MPDEEKNEEEKKAEDKKDEKSSSPPGGEEKPEDKKSKEAGVPKSEYEKIKKELVELKGKLAKEKEQELKEKEEFKTLWNQEQEKGKAMNERLKEKELKLIAVSNGLVDPDFILLVKDKFKFDEDLNCTNVDEVLKDLKTSRPHFFKTGNPGVAETDTGMPNNYGGSAFTKEQIKKMTPEEFRKNEPKIFEQMKKGLIK